MKSISKKSPSPLKKTLLATGSVALVALLFATFYVYGMGGNLFGWQANPVDSTKITTNENDASNDKPDATTNPTGNGKPATPGTSDTPAAKPDTTTANTLSASITAANQNGSMLQIRTLIEEVTSSGSCTLTLTKDSWVVTRTVAIQALASSSTCKGFDIPVSELSTGQWQLAIDISISDKKAHLTKTITII